MLIGTQIWPHAILDEGIDSALDLMVREGNINALMLNTHTYYGAANGWRERGSLADDHGVELAEHPQDSVAGAWIRHRHPFFTKEIGHRGPPEMRPGTDPYLRIIEAARDRGMAVYARIIEGWEPARLRHIPGWRRLCTVDVYGEPHCIPCFANPLFRQWWQATVEDIFQYPVEGIFYGFERGETLSDVLFHAQRPYCFCRWCRERAQAHNIDVERAREGYVHLHRVMLEKTGESTFTAIIRVLVHYPEILQWARLEQRGKEETARSTASTAHRGDRLFGTFGCREFLDPIKSAWEMDSAILDVCDFFVPRVYADVSGPRLVRGLRTAPRNDMYRGLSSGALSQLAAIISGTPSLRSTSRDQLASGGMPLDYVEACIGGYAAHAGDNVDLYAGVGVDIPAPDDPGRKTDPGYLTKVVERCLQQGVNGIVLCREYEEIRALSMRVIANAVRNPARRARERTEERKAIPTEQNDGAQDDVSAPQSSELEPMPAADGWLK